MSRPPVRPAGVTLRRCPPLTTALVQRSPGETRVALLADEVVWELYHFRDDEALVGDIFLGRVRGRTAKSAAAFVDLGLGPDGFLAVEDCPQGLPPEGSLILVEVLLAARAEKGPKLTAFVSLGGEVLAYSPLRPGANVSQKITNKAERTRLLDWAEGALQPNEGLVLRTRAWDTPEAALEAALVDARRRWQQIQQAQQRQKGPGRVAGGSLPLAAALNGRSVGCVLYSGALAREQALQARPDLAEALRPARSGLRLWDDEGVTEATEQALSERCGLLTIEQTAAVTAIDVDSGPHSPEDANLLVLPEIARQIRLRNVAGMIVVDFAAPRRGAEGHKKALAQALAQLLADDPARPQVLGVSALGLVEIRRSRRGAPLADLFYEGRSKPLPALSAVALEALRQVVADVAADPALRPCLRASAVLLDGLRGPWRAALAEAEAALGAPLPLEQVVGVPRHWFSVVPVAAEERQR